MQRGASSLTPGRGTRRSLITVALTMTIMVAGFVFPAAAFAHHPEITATVDCDRKVDFTATAWATSSASARTNPEIGIFYSTNGGTSFTRLPHKSTYQFSATNGFTFSDSFTLPSGATQVIVKAQAMKKWANGGDPGTPRQTANLMVPGCPDVQIIKTDSPDPVAKNGELHYTIAVKNNGPSTAKAVVVEDVLPAGVSYVSSTTSKGSCSFSVVKLTCTLGDLAKDASALIGVKVTAVQCGKIVNTASVKFTGTDSNPSNNSSSAETTVNCPGPDLEIVKTDHPDPLRLVGDEVTYTISVKNLGPGTATGVTVKDVLQNDVWHVSHNSSKGNCNVSGQTVTCNVGTLASGESATITIVATLDRCGTIPNTATVSAYETDTNTANNSSTTETTVRCDEDEPDLEIVKIDNMDPAPAGSELIYTITVKNLGPGTAHNVVVTDTIQHSSWRVWEEPTASQGDCDPDDADTGDVIVCDLGDLDDGESATVTIKIKARLCETMTNTAVVSADEDDPYTGNNSDTEHTVIDGSCDKDPDMSIVTDAPTKARIGDVITYNMTIHQGGPEYGTGINVVNRLDPTVEFISASASQGACTATETAKRIHCDLGEMDVFETATVTVTAMATRAGTVRNRAEVDVNEFDAVLSNNVSIHETEVSSPKTKSKRFVASDDASIYKNAPNKKLGRSDSLEADKRALKKFLLKFNVKGLKGKRILSATLRLYSVGRSPDGGSVHAMTDTSWTERSVSWAAAPSHSGSALGSAGSVDEGKWYEIDVTDGVLGEGAVSFAVGSSNTDGADYASRNAGRRYAPQLIVALIETASKNLVR